jgi:hypothetical protein
MGGSDRLRRTPDEQRRLARIDIGLLTAMVMPNGRDIAARLATDFSAWLFAFDDCYADEHKGLPIAELAALLSRLSRVLEAPASGPAEEVVIGLPFIQALRDVRVRLAAIASPTQVSRWSEAMRAYFMATLWEAIDIIIRQDRCTADQALSRAVAIRDKVMCRYLRLRDQVLRNSSTELSQYVNSLGYWVRGNIQWGQQSSRYASIDGLSAAHSAEGAAEPVDDSPGPVPVPTIAWWWGDIGQ